MKPNDNASTKQTILAAYNFEKKNYNNYERLNSSCITVETLYTVVAKNSMCTTAIKCFRFCCFSGSAIEKTKKMAYSPGKSLGGQGVQRIPRFDIAKSTLQHGMSEIYM